MKKLLLVVVIVVLVIALAAAAVVVWIAFQRRKNSATETAHAPRVSVEEYTKGDDLKVEYVAVRLDDKTVETSLNDDLRDFYLAQWLRYDGKSSYAFVDEDIPPQPKEPYDRYEGKATYAVVTDFLSVTRALTSTNLLSSAWPLKEFSAQTYNLRTGGLFSLPLTTAQLRQAIDEGKFRQVHPEKPIEGAAAQLSASLGEGPTPFYLTETAVGLYLNDPKHEEGEYWLFEAKIDDLPIAFATYPQ